MSNPSQFPDDTQVAEACLARFAAGDPAARDELIAIASGRMRAIAHRMLRAFPSVRRWDETDDVVQNAAIRLCRALSQVNPTDARAFMGLAAIQVRRELLDLARKHSGSESHGANHDTNTQRFDGEFRSRLDDAPAAAETPEQLEGWTRLHEAAESLPDDERELFHLAWYMGLKQEEISRLTDCSIRTVKRRWESAKRAIAAALGGDAPHGTAQPG